MTYKPSLFASYEICSRVTPFSELLEQFEYIPRKATNNDFSLAMNINSGVQACNGLLLRALLLMLTEKSAIYDLPRYRSDTMKNF